MPNRRVPLQLTVALLLACLAAACAPGANVERAPAFTAAWNGPIETVALVMSPPASSVRVFAESTYNLSSLEFLRHPYARQRFDVIERARMDVVLNELGLGQSGLVDTSTAPQLGRLLGARYVIVVDLINLSVRPSSLSGLRLSGVPLGFGMADLDITLMVRMVDVETGRVRASGAGRVQDVIFTGISVDGLDFSSPATRELVLDLVPEAALRAFNDLFRQIV